MTRHADGVDATVAALAIVLSQAGVYVSRLSLCRDDIALTAIWVEVPCAGVDERDARQTVQTRLEVAGVPVEAVHARRVFD